MPSYSAACTSPILICCSASRLTRPSTRPIAIRCTPPAPQGYIDYPTLADASNRALRIHAYGGADAISIDQVDMPSVAPNEVLVRVHAAGVNGLDWKIRDGILQDVFRLPMPATLGIELAGEVIETGSRRDAVRHRRARDGRAGRPRRLRRSCRDRGG